MTVVHKPLITSRTAPNPPTHDRRLLPVAGPRVDTRRTSCRILGEHDVADDSVSFVSAAQAKEIDEKLMGPEFGFGKSARGLRV